MKWAILNQHYKIFTTQLSSSMIKQHYDTKGIYIPLQAQGAGEVCKIRIGSVMFAVCINFEISTLFKGEQTENLK